MCGLRKYLFFIVSCLIFIQGCSGNSEKKQEIVKSINALEGTPFSVELNSPPSDLKADNVFVSYEGNFLKGIAPSVREDTIFEINLGDERIVEIAVTNKSLPEISSKLRPYAFSSPNIAKYNNYLKTGNPVPLVPIGSEMVHYPVTVSKYAHDLYANFLITGDDDIYDKFIINADWLKNNCIYTNYGFCSWRTEPAYTPYNTGDDWASAMGQGQSISVLISAASLTGDSSYLSVAQDAVAAFYYPGNVKGVNSTWDDHLWYEEYTSESPEHVLNGFLFSVAGLYDAMELLNDVSAENLWIEGMKALESKLSLYDAGFTSLYDNADVKRFANAKGRSLDGYHELHILQLAWLYQVTKNAQFKTAFHKFLANDIGSFRSKKVKSLDSQKIKKITASHSVRVDSNGPSFLNDRNWTYGNYWSTNRNGTYIELELNGVDNSDGISCVMMAARETKYFPSSFELHTTDDAGQFNVSLTREQVSNIEPIDNKWVWDDKESIARNYCFENPIKTNNKLRIVTFLGEGNLIALRELDVHFRRESLEDEILDIYSSWVK